MCPIGGIDYSIFCYCRYYLEYSNPLEEPINSSPLRVSILSIGSGPPPRPSPAIKKENSSCLERGQSGAGNLVRICIVVKYVLVSEQKIIKVRLAIIYVADSFMWF